MTGEFHKKLEVLRDSSLGRIEQDLARSRERLIEDSFGFLKLAWEADATTYERLNSPNAVAGTVVELYVGAEDREVIGQTSNERVYDISFSTFSIEEGIRTVRFGFLLPKELDFRDAYALAHLPTPFDVYVTQEHTGNEEVTQWVTRQGIEPFIFGGSEDIDSDEIFKSDDVADPTADEAYSIDPQRAREIRQTTSLREALQRWQFIASSTIQVTENGIELV